MTQQFLNVRQAAEFLNVSISRITVLCRQGRIIGAQKVGRDWIIPPEPKVTAGSRYRAGKIQLQPE